MWEAKTKNDLIIEVWEKLDCENIGADEIIAIESVIADQFGQSAVESPMMIARLLADEGAELRHSEIMNLYVERASDRPYDAAFRNIADISDLDHAAASIRKLENLRRKYLAEKDKEGLRLVRETGQKAKSAAVQIAAKDRIEPILQKVNQEIAQWFIIWLETPEVFESWVELRKRSAEFTNIFGESKESN